jgi:tetratricopeptide (TPR) repeat protein
MASRAFLIGSMVSLLCAPGALADPHSHHAGDADQLGSVSFPTSCSAESQAQFTKALAMLHSFWYPEAKNAFADVAGREPDCAIAHWGVAQSLFHPLWAPPAKTDLAEGTKALAKAERARLASPRERAYIAALAAYYRDHETLDHPTRAERWRRAMEKVQAAYPDDHEAAVFHALALLGTAPRTDTTYANQKKAAAILENIWPAEREHPGVAHLLIHSYDSPAMAAHGVEAARAYAKVAPAAAHALHMPSHIFSRLGLWQESAASNIASADAARRYSEAGKPSYGDEVHALDFLMNAYMQMRDLEAAERVIARLRAMPPAEPGRAQMFYATVVIPARYLVEQGRWKEAGGVGPVDGNESTRALIHWIRGTGAARSGNLRQAREEAAHLATLAAAAKKDPDSEDAEEFEALQLSVTAWTALADGRKDEALRLMRQAADLFDTLLYSYAPIPVREQLGDMLSELGRPAEALTAYEATLAARPGRFNSLLGAARAAAALGQTVKSEAFLAKLARQAPNWAAKQSGAARGESH